MQDWFSNLPLVQLSAWLEEMPKKADLKDKRLLLTANQRLSRFILQKRQVQFSARVLPSQNITSYEQWRSALWLKAEERGLTRGKVLAAPQERFVWQQLLSEQAQADGLLADNKSLAKSLSDARAIVATWAIPLSELAQENYKEASFLLEVLEKFTQRYEVNGWITPEQQTGQLIELLESGALPKVDSIGIYGFTELNPLQQALLCNASSALRQVSPPQPSNLQCQFKEYSDWQVELEQIARWANKRLQQSPDISLGVVLPNLQKFRTQVDRVFTRQFDSAYLLEPNKSPSDRPYELSIGNPLIEEPVIADALALTRLIQKQFTKEEGIDLLRSVFWGAKDNVSNEVNAEGITGAINQTDDDFKALAADARLRALEMLDRWEIPTLQLVQFVDIIAKAEQKSVAQVARNAGEINGSHAVEPPVGMPSKLILEVVQKYRLAANKLPFQHWNSFFKRYLLSLNWPGERTLSSREYQAVEQFKGVLDELLVDQRCFIESNLVTFPAYVSHLKQRLSERVFQQQSPRKPIQITGTIEAMGLAFDECWIGNVTRNQFPESPQPNPFLPVQIQKKYDTPRCSPQKELKYAQAVLDSLGCCSSNITYSYSVLSEDEHHQISPLLYQKYAQEYDETKISAKEQQDDVEPTHYETAYNNLNRDDVFAYFHDTVGLPLVLTGGTAKIRRGVTALGTYALNPFYSYLVYRLGAKQPNTEYVGVSPQARGNILHNVLEQFWQNTHGTEQLKAKIENKEALGHELEALILGEINQVLRIQLPYLPSSLVDLEVHRCQSLLLEWLELEADRPIFSVHATEQSFELTLKTVRFSIRVDRVDELACSAEDASRILLIDYKTGATPISALQRHPLIEPQLPIYTQISELEASAVCLAQLKPNACEFVGIGEDQTQIKGIQAPSSLKRYDLPNEWSEVLEWWQEDLHRSVTGITEGKAVNVTANSTYESRYSYLSAIIRAEQQEELALKYRATEDDR